MAYWGCSVCDYGMYSVTLPEGWEIMMIGVDEDEQVTICASCAA